MTTETVKTGRDTWASAEKPNLNRNASRKLIVEGSTAYSYKMAKVDIPEGSIVTSATLTFFAAGPSTGSRTLTLSRLEENWKPSQLTWNNKPTVIAGSGVTATVGTLKDGDPITFNVAAHLQAITDGSPHYGWRLLTSAATRHKVWGVDSDHPPVLTYTYMVDAVPPTNLSPSDGATSTRHPVLTFSHDPADDAELVSVRIQIDSARDNTPDFDSGWVNSSVPELDLAATAYAGLPTDGSWTYWRAAVIDTTPHGVLAEWSDWHLIRYVPQGTLTLTTPTSGGLVYDATPDISWTLTGTGVTQFAWRVIVTRAGDPTAVIHDSGKRTGTASTYTLGPKVIDDEATPYTVTVRTWDSTWREATPGRPTYLEASRTFVMADGTTGAPNSLTAYADPDTPAVHLSWDSPTPVDSHTIVRDGVLLNQILEVLVDPEDTQVGETTTHQWTDWTAAPGVEHTYYVRGVSSAGQSARSAGAHVTTHPKGVWLVDPVTEVWVCASGLDGVAAWSRADTYGLYQPLGASKPVKVTSAMSGLVGEFAGEFYRTRETGRTVAEQTTHLHKLAERPDRVLRLVAGDINIPVVVADLSAGTHPELLRSGDRCRVSWKFWQYGELPFTPGL